MAGLVVTSAAVLPATAAHAAPAATPTLPSNCSQTSVGGTVTCTYTQVGESTFAVPTGVSSLAVTATGAAGGDSGPGVGYGSNNGGGGLGATAQSTIATNGISTLFVEVGGMGSNDTTAAGGANGGGSSVPDTNFREGAGGGGASDVRTSSASTPLTTDDTRLIVAGGGGGLGSCSKPGKGGDAGSQGGTSPCESGATAGSAGTDITGGAAGASGATYPTPTATDGSLGQGGMGAIYGGGGGGGYYGGGGGGDTAGGGGGSSYAPDGTVSLASTPDDGSVVISYSPGTASALRLSPATANITLGGSQTYTATSVDSSGATIADVTSSTTFAVSTTSTMSTPGTAGSCTGATCTPAAAGSNTVTGSDGALTGTASLTVAKASLQPGGSSITSTAYGTEGSRVIREFTRPAGTPAPTGQVTVTATQGSTTTTICSSATVATSGTDVSARCDFGLALGTPLLPGSYLVTFTFAGDSNFNAITSTIANYSVFKATPAVGVTASPTSGSYGSAQSFTATITGVSGGVAPTGTVDFSYTTPSNSTPTALCTGATVSTTGSPRTASCTTAPPVGTNYTITATYNGDSVYNSKSGSTSNFTVSKATPSTSLSANPSGGQTYPNGESFTATVTGVSGAAAPTGTVSFAYTTSGSSTSTTLCSAAPLSTSGGVTSATCTPSSALTVGNYTVTATYSGDGNYNVGTAGTITTYTVSQGGQAIVFGTGPSSVSAQSTGTVSATGGGSTKPVVISRDAASTDGTCSVFSTGNGTASVAYGHPGTCVIDANQAGDANYTASAQAQKIVTVVARATSISSETPPTVVYGRSATVTARITAVDGTTPAGAVQFRVAGTAVGSPVAVDGNGVATSPNLTLVGGKQLDPGSYRLEAVFTPTSVDYASSSAIVTAVTVTKATSTTSVAVSDTAITATVAAVAPGAGTPTGTVTFSVAGSQVGTAQLTNGVATLAYAVPDDSAKQVSAVYAGDADFTDSSDSTARTNPTITASVTSSKPKSAAGWYSAPVTVTFDCTVGSAPLTEDCPAPVTLGKDGAGQSVTKTIMATDGGTATASVTGIDIDTTAPSVQVTRVHNGDFVPAGTTPICAGTDALSGIASCTMSYTLVKHSGTGLNPSIIDYTATATDKAGNVRRVSGSYTSLGIYLAGATYKDGIFYVKSGASYPVAVTGYRSTPTFQSAVPYNSKPTRNGPKLLSTGTNSWAITLDINRVFAGRHDWNIGVLTGDGVQHVIHLHV